MTNTNPSIQPADIIWQDGQPVSRLFNDVYFSREGGVAETEYVFLRHNQLPDRWRHRQQFVLAETGFGSGLNFITTAYHWLAAADRSARLFYISIEKYPLSKADLQRALAAWPHMADCAEELIRSYPPAIPGFHQLALFNQRIILLLLLGDVETMLQQLHAKVDAWYLDGFAPAKNPEMWTDRVFAEIARLSQADASFSSFTAAGHVRRGLAAQGFDVIKSRGFGNKRDMLHGRMHHRPGYQSPFPWYEIPAVSYPAKRAAIIGAGIAGMTTAQALAKRGWQLDVFEQHGHVAPEASGNPAGVLLPRIALDDSVEGSFYATAYQHAVHALSQLKQMDPTLNWRASGVLQLARSERIQRQLEQGQFDERFVRTVTAEQASAIAGIRLQQPALYFPAAGWLQPAQLCQLLAQSSNGIHVRCNETVQHIHYEDSQWQLVNPGNDMLGRYDCLILANAYAVRQFAQTDWLPLQAVRGQISYLAASEVLQGLHCPVCYEGYILPEQQHQHVIGATFMADDNAADIRKLEHEQNLAALLQAIPALADAISPSAVISGRAAVRAVTPDRMPLAGPVADRTFFDHHYADLAKGRAASCYAEANYLPGLYVNTGHGARGLTSGFLVAELLAGQINNEPLPVSYRVLHGLLAARFLIRAYKKGQTNS